MDVSTPPPPVPPPPPPPPHGILTNPSVPKFDSSVPPPAVPFSADAFQTLAWQWHYYQQAQVAAAAAYQTQCYQSIAQQNKTPSAVPPPTTNHNATTTSKWQPTSNNSSSNQFRPRQGQTSNRPRFSAPGTTTNTNSNFQSYNNVPPPASLTPAKPAHPSIRFHLNTRPTAPTLSAGAVAANRPGGRRSRFSSPPKTNTNRNETNKMDTSQTPTSLTAIEAYTLALDKAKWPLPLR